MPEWMKQLLSSGAYFEAEGGGGGGGDPPVDPPVDPANKPTDAEAKLLKEVMALKEAKKAAEAAKAASDAAAAKAKADAEAGVTKLSALQAELAELLGTEGVDGLKKRLDEVKAEEERKLAAAGEFDKLKATMVASHNKAMGDLRAELNGKIKAAEDKAAAAEGTVRKLVVTNNFASSQYRTTELNLGAAHAERIFGSAFKVEDVDGELKPVGYRGAERLVGADGKPLAFDEAFKEIVTLDPEHTIFVKTKDLPGAGSKGGAGGGGDKGVKDQDVRGLSRIQSGLNVKK